MDFAILTKFNLESVQFNLGVKFFCVTKLADVRDVFLTFVLDSDCLLFRAFQTKKLRFLCGISVRPFVSVSSYFKKQCKHQAQAHFSNKGKVHIYKNFIKKIYGIKDKLNF